MDICGCTPPDGDMFSDFREIHTHRGSIYISPEHLPWHDVYAVAITSPDGNQDLFTTTAPSLDCAETIANLALNTVIKPCRNMIAPPPPTPNWQELRN